MFPASLHLRVFVGGTGRLHLGGAGPADGCRALAGSVLRIKVVVLHSANVWSSRNRSILRAPLQEDETGRAELMLLFMWDISGRLVFRYIPVHCHCRALRERHRRARPRRHRSPEIAAVTGQTNDALSNQERLVHQAAVLTHRSVRLAPCFNQAQKRQTVCSADVRAVDGQLFCSSILTRSDASSQ